MSQLYFSLVTNQGRNKLALSAAGGAAVTITHFAIGDGNGAEVNPTAANTALVHEVWRTPVDSVEIDPDNPSAVLVTAIIPTNAGGFWMREFGIFDASGEMIAVAKPVSQYKPTALEGQLEDIRYEFQIVVGDTANVTLLVDPSVLLASREWVESRKTPINRLAATPWLALKSMSVTAPPANAQSGDLYLVPAGATGAWAGHAGKLAEYVANTWSIIDTPNGHGISLPDGRVFEKVGGSYIEKIARDAQSGRWNYAVAGGTANALTAALSPEITGYSAGLTVQVAVQLSNTGPVSLNLGGGARAVLTRAGNQLQAGDLLAGSVYTCVYNGNNWTILLDGPRVLTGDVNLFVRADGSDSNDGAENTPTRAFRTIQAAVLSAQRRYISAGYGITVRVAAGAYTPFVVDGAGVLITLIGDLDNPGNCAINAAGAQPAVVARRGATIIIRGIAINGATGPLIVSEDRSSIGVGEVRLGSTANYQLVANTNSTITQIGDIVISGSAPACFVATAGGVINGNGSPITFTGPVHYSVATIWANNGTVGVAGSVFVGDAHVSGTRYLADVTGLIWTAGSGENFIPGNAAGVTGSGGLYL